MLPRSGRHCQYGGGRRTGSGAGGWPQPWASPFQLQMAGEAPSFFDAPMAFGAPTDATLSELAVEAFFPVDAETATWVCAQAD
ncbi:MAG TPA: hypothetical protein VHY32_07870 [Caulobacteraceae bacterium]|nr:hypothetical protein [Caulobacteraceae bacterium]